MKKTLITALVATATIAMSTTAFALIAGSAHDVASPALGLSACEYCHTPHNASSTLPERAPLWNRNNATASFSLYGDTIASEAAVENRPTSGAPGANSLTCLSCHDGATSMGNLINKGNAGGNTGADERKVGDGVFSNNFAANLGADLSDDHPVGFVFVADVAGPGGHGVPLSVYANGGGTDSAGRGFLLYGSAGGFTFECASCHDPHDTETGNAGRASNYFLRAPWASICTDCHSAK